MPENQTAWKSNNQGVKEETFIQTTAPHLHVDNPGGTMGEQDRLHNPGLQYWEIKPQSL